MDGKAPRVQRVEKPRESSDLANEEAATRLVGVLGIIPSLLRAAGVDPAPVLARAGLAGDALNDPAGRIAYANLLRLLHEAIRASGLPHFGLLVGRAWSISQAGLPGEILRHSPTVGEGLAEFIVRHHLNDTAALPFLQTHGEMADLGYALFLPVPDSPAPFYDAVIAAGVNLMRELCGSAWAPSAVLLAHAAPADVEPYRRHFRSPVRFHSEINAIRFPAHYLARPIAGADAQRLRQARAEANAAAQPPFTANVHRALRTLLLHGRYGGSDVAQVLGMHRRTLIRRLGADHTSFQRILDEVRNAVARELLRDTGIPLRDIAACVGYASVPPFIRAFQRWNGTTPGAWRAGAHGGDGPAPGQQFRLSAEG
ncbi:MAG: AraC family transcriptional regulator [bacterium]|nr:MAG: AraC family transcriptional regulator [bacterium]KAF0148644.1 MAG: AraC family transcriptional regulator [bacterium]KAF0167948.1 MAG: AraC family transcriptional regulator [bacterium]TXT18160.1 MAG: AraC family transcriptional regulator [bacterium]